VSRNMPTEQRMSKFPKKLRTSFTRLCSLIALPK
jgi:hypothetical protein